MSTQDFTIRQVHKTRLSTQEFTNPIFDVCRGGYHAERVQVDTIHHDAGYDTVHHDAEYQTVHHDAVTHTETTYTCSGCGATK